MLPLKKHQVFALSPLICLQTGGEVLAGEPWAVFLQYQALTDVKRLFSKPEYTGKSGNPSASLMLRRLQNQALLTALEYSVFRIALVGTFWYFIRRI